MKLTFYFEGKVIIIKDELLKIVDALGKVICSDELSSKNNIILLDVFNDIKKVIDELN